MCHRLRTYLLVRVAWSAASQAEGSARATALNVGRPPDRSGAGSRSLARAPRSGAWVLRDRVPRVAFGWHGGRPRISQGGGLDGLWLTHAGQRAAIGLLRAAN